jgi:Cupin-like domain
MNVMTTRSYVKGNASSATLLSSPDALRCELKSKFDRQPFVLEHSLSGNPLFTLAALMQLSRKLEQNIYYDMGDIQIDDRWSDVPPRQYSELEALEQIENGKIWFFIKIKTPEQAPAYAEVLDQCLAEAEKLVDCPFRHGMRNQEMTIFVTSPHRVSTYHIDRECSFLLQIQGEKTIHVFDRNDRELLPEEEIETFWTADNNAPRYRPQYQNRAQTYLLKPGKAVHIPVNCPHWVENHDNVSISVNINVQFPDAVRADIYRANHYLRKFGLNPTPPTHSPMLDAAKVQAYSGARRVLGLVGKRLP